MPKLYVYQRAEDLGIPVVDATDRVLVTVTNGDVINAKKANSKHCALARAALRLPLVNGAYFFRGTAYLEFADRMVRMLLPPSVQKEIVSFDRARVFAPGIYQLTPPNPARAREKTQAYRNKVKRRVAKEARLATVKPVGGIRDKIEKIAASESAATTPEAKEWHKRIDGILGVTAPMPLKKRKAHHHRTQYIRGMSEP